MSEFLIYNLKAGVCLVAFYLFYKLLLSRDTFHRFNRGMLLFIMALSFVLPLCVITIHRELPAVETAMPAAINALVSEFRAVSPAETTVNVAEATPAVAKPAPAEWGDVIDMLFVAGIAVALIFTVIAIVKVVLVIRSGQRERLDRRTVLVRKNEPVAPFSWLRYIVVSYTDYAENGAEIIAHERAHIYHRHSYDLFLANLCACVQWFNPAMWLLRQELRNIHEYEADRAVLAAGADAKKYQLFLIKKAVGTGRYSIANSLNHSNLKNRITMMLQKKSPTGARAKALVLLPLVFVGLSAFATTVWVAPEPRSEPENKVTTKNYEILTYGDEPSGDKPYSAPVAIVSIRDGWARKVKQAETSLEEGRRIEMMSFEAEYIAVPQLYNVVPAGDTLLIDLTDIGAEASFLRDGAKIMLQIDKKDGRELKTMTLVNAPDEVLEHVTVMVGLEDGIANRLILKEREVGSDGGNIYVYDVVQPPVSVPQLKNATVKDENIYIDLPVSLEALFIKDGTKVSLLERKYKSMTSTGYFTIRDINGLNSDGEGGTNSGLQSLHIIIPSDTVRFTTSKMLTAERDTVDLTSGYYVLVPEDGDGESKKVIVEHIDGKPLKADGKRVRVMFAEKARLKYNTERVEAKIFGWDESDPVADTVLMWSAESYPGGLWRERTANDKMADVTAMKKQNILIENGNYLFLDIISIVVYDGGEITVEDRLVAGDGFMDAVIAAVKEKGKTVDDFNYIINYSQGTPEEFVQRLLDELEKGGAAVISSTRRREPLRLNNAMEFD